MNYRIILFFFFLFTSSMVRAESTQAVKPDWKASAELGYVATTGNTETDTVNLKANYEKEKNKWRHKLNFAALQSSTSNVSTAEKYTLEGQSNYLFKAPNYFFVNINYEVDHFSGYEYQVTESVGYGRRVVDNEKVKLDLEAGPGARQSKLENGGTDEETTFRAALKLDWTISKSSRFTEEFTVESGDNSTITKSISALSSKINSSLSMKVTYAYKDVSDTPVGIENTDTETAVTLVYTF